MTVFCLRGPACGRAGNKLASRVPLPVRSQQTYAPSAGSTPAVDMVLPADFPGHGSAGRGISLFLASHSPSAASKLLLCRARLLHGPLPPRFQHPTCFPPSGLLTSWTLPTPIPQPTSFSSVGPDCFLDTFHPDSAACMLQFTYKILPASRIKQETKTPERL